MFISFSTSTVDSICFVVHIYPIFEVRITGAQISITYVSIPKSCGKIDAVCII